MIDNVGAGLSANSAETKNHQIKTCPSTLSINLDRMLDLLILLGWGQFVGWAGFYLMIWAGMFVDG